MLEDDSNAPEGTHASVATPLSVTVPLATVKALIRIGPLRPPPPCIVPIGLCLEEGPLGAVLVACDGNVLVAYRACAIPRPKRETVIPYDWLKELPSSGGRLTIVTHGDGWLRLQAAVKGDSGGFECPALTVPYPDWRSLLPERFNPDHRETAFDPVQQARVEDCIAAIVGTKQSILICDAPGVPHRHSEHPVRYITTHSAEIIGVIQGREELERSRFGCPAWARP